VHTKLFVGLTFHEDNFFARKIQGFRNRFDEKVLTNPAVHMPLVAPFEIPSAGLANLEQEVAELLEGFFFGDAGSQSVSFTGVDVYTHAKRSLLYLHPAEQTDFLHCEEALIQVCQEYVEDRSKRPSKDKKFVTIGRFHDPASLHGALAVAQEEFSDCSELPVKGISLFRKHQGIWYQQALLMGLDVQKGEP
jgi:hypothetical protein